MPQIPVFVINLKRSEDRRTRVREVLGSVGLTYEFIEAVDGNDFSEDEVAEIRRNSSDPRKNSPSRKPFSRGEIGCALSHLKAYERIVKEGLDYACIMEDDIVIEHPGILSTMLERDTLVALRRKRRFGLIWLFVSWQNKEGVARIFPNAASLSALNARWGKTRIEEGFYLCKPCVAPLYGNVCYIVTKEACDILLKEGLRKLRPSDELTACAELLGINCFFVDPAPANHEFGIKSVIDPDDNVRFGSRKCVPGSISIWRIAWCRLMLILRRSGIIPYKWLIRKCLFYD